MINKIHQELLFCPEILFDTYEIYSVNKDSTDIDVISVVGAVQLKTDGSIIGYLHCQSPTGIILLKRFCPLTKEG